MSVRAFLLRLFLSMGVLLMVLGIVEVWLRSRLFSNDPAYVAWRDPQLYTHRYKVDGRTVVRDDHDKLAVQWGLLQPSSDHPHSLLGWCGGLDSSSLLPKGFAPGQRYDEPILLGAGWAEHHVRPSRHDSMLRALPPAYTDLSIAGFSLDQDLLLFEHIHAHLRGRRLLLHVNLDDLDRSQRAFVGRPKPWFTLGPYACELHGVPVTTDVAEFLEAAPADPGLYTYHLFRAEIMHDTLMSASAAESQERELRELTKKLLFSLLFIAAEDSTSVSIYLEQNTLGALADRRRWAVQDVCRDMKISCHVLPEEAEAIGQRDQVGMMRIFMDNLPAPDGLVHYTSLSDLNTLMGKPETERTQLEHVMASILKDTSWSQQIREKAADEHVSFAMMVERDARFVIDHEQQ